MVDKPSSGSAITHLAWSFPHDPELSTWASRSLHNLCLFYVCECRMGRRLLECSPFCISEETGYVQILAPNLLENSRHVYVIRSHDNHNNYELTSYYTRDGEADDKRCLINFGLEEIRVPAGIEKVDSKPAMTPYCRHFYVITSIQFNSGIYRRRLHAWPAAPYNKFKIKISFNFS